MPLSWPNGTRVSNRIQPYDATFGLEKTDAFVLHRAGGTLFFPARKAVSTFDDTNPNSYWFESNPMASTKVAGTGTKIAVKAKQGDGLKVAVSFQR